MLFCGPGWEEGKPRTGLIEDIPNVSFIRLKCQKHVLFSNDKVHLDLSLSNNACFCLEIFDFERLHTNLQCFGASTISGFIFQI